MHFFNTESFVRQHVTGRTRSFFQHDINNNEARLSREIKGKSVLVIGGAGTIGSSYIKALLRFEPAKVVVIDTSENGLTELVRDCRSSANIQMPAVFLTYPVSFSDDIFYKIFKKEGPFDIVANFAAHKHVRSEKDIYSIEAMVANNVLNAHHLLRFLLQHPPRHFFCVSTDKAANPVNVMGASKKLMEEIIMAYAGTLKISTARFANVAFSNGSLLAGFIDRLLKTQPLSCPNDVRRFFVSPQEAGEICLLACILGESGDVFYPKLDPGKDLVNFADIIPAFLQQFGLTPVICASEKEAKDLADSFAPAGGKQYPVHLFSSNTSGEKLYEEFFTENEETDEVRYQALGVIKNVPRRNMEEIETTIRLLSDAFKKEMSKAEIVGILKEALPTFQHIETGLNLDQKM
ncbi:polysaccharide biosynthesis protein [Chitinophaga lutea]